MLQKIVVILAGTVGGMFLAYFLITNTNILAYHIDSSTFKNILKISPTTPPIPKKLVIGFLPFWLIDKAQADYSPYITQLSYFNIVIDDDGTIQKFTAPGESDPGWRALQLGKIDNYLSEAKAKGIELSLTIFSGNDTKIDKFLENPIQSADNLVSEVLPLIETYGFSDINLDIERVAESTPSQREKYTEFVREVRNKLPKGITITIDMPGIAFIRDKNLCDPKPLSEIADYIVLMGYDFHNAGSYVTGPVAPQSGAGIISEFDIESAVQSALTQVPTSKLILAAPLYGYSWESINKNPRSAVMPGSGYSMSSRSVQELLAGCATCSAEFDKTDSESHLIYKDNGTGLYHQVFYPDRFSTQVKVDFASSQDLAGMALWALGYEDNAILKPLENFK